MDSGYLTIHHCPTEDMVGDYFTKPLQGEAFINIRDLIMGKVAHNFSSTSKEQTFETSAPRSVLGNEPRVGPSDVNTMTDHKVNPNHHTLVSAVHNLH